MPPRSPAGAAVLAALTTLAASSPALATQSLTVSGAVSLGGDAAPFYDTFTVKSTGVLTVNAYQAGQAASTGWLVIKANTITVEAGGVIDAGGAGYAGQDGKYGSCALMSAATCAGPGLSVGVPGGGGGFFAAGADGTHEDVTGTCTDYGSQSRGGSVFFDMMTHALDLGSAGGAGDLPSPTATAGAAGGGGVRLSAAVIFLDGAVRADGRSANPFGGVGPGGGSGGAIEITAAMLTGSGTLSVKGGDGAHGAGIGVAPFSPPTSFPPNNGGGGSGGVVLVHLPAGATSPITVVADGGHTGDCPSGGGPAGGAVSDPLASACVDVDGDGHPSVQCGGDDCDDSDPTVHPGAPEICNGKDDNCDGQIDEAPNDCTLKGEICGMVGGVPGCVSGGSDGGAGDGGDVPAYIDYSGGCAVPAGLPRAPARSGATLILGLGALGLGVRRARRARRAAGSRRWGARRSGGG